MCLSSVSACVVPRPSTDCCVAVAMDTANAPGTCLCSGMLGVVPTEAPWPLSPPPSDGLSCKLVMGLAHESSSPTADRCPDDWCLRGVLQLKSLGKSSESFCLCVRLCLRSCMQVSHANVFISTRKNLSREVVCAFHRWNRKIGQGSPKHILPGV